MILVISFHAKQKTGAINSNLRVLIINLLSPKSELIA
jgi:hypothetical protein